MSNETKQQEFLLEPRSPLIFRSGLPFGSLDDGGGANGYTFPIPATVAGAIRSAYVDQTNWQFNNQNTPENLRNKVQIEGALLSSWQVGKYDQPKLYFQKPADAIYHAEKREPDKEPKILINKLSPSEIDDNNEGIDGGENINFSKFLPALSKNNVKPAEGPIFWEKEKMNNWLMGSELYSAEGLGIKKLKYEIKTHVGINPKTLSAEEGKLFQSLNIDFSPNIKKTYTNKYQFGLLVRVKENQQDNSEYLSNLNNCNVRLGADGRTVKIINSQANQFSIAKNLKEKLDECQENDIIRLILATPAFFKNGFLPDNLDPETLKGSIIGDNNWEFEIISAVIDRWIGYSGYSIRKENRNKYQEKSALRLVPAGSVYWLKILKKDKNQNGKKISKISDYWLKSICSETYSRDGFGLALWGVK